ncbi:MAG: chorismate-binding protein, partial [Halomonas sp.]|nr:chorismate-binding protein [Halomonas sp.]
MTSALILTALPYLPDPLTTFAVLRQRQGAVLLDSGRPLANGRFDIISSDPLATLEIDAHGQPRVASDQLNAPLDWPDAFAPQQWLLDQFPLPPQDMGELPFVGGLIGYWGYDLGREQQSIASQQPCVTDLPQARIGLYDWCITLDHHTQQAWLVATAERREKVMRWLGRSVPATAPFFLTASFQAELSRADYHQRFHAVQDYIRAGDCYQINLAQRFSASYQGDEWQAYLRLRRATPTPFSGFMAWQDKAVLSLSPERF